MGEGVVELAVVTADITERPCDLLLLKHADGFYGVDAIVSKRLGFRAGVPEGEATFLAGRNIEAQKVLYIGVGPLGEFRYPQIRAFGRKALALANQDSGRTKVLCTPLHGPGYGLDEREAFLSLVGGFLDGIESGAFPEDLNRQEGHFAPVRYTRSEVHSVHLNCKSSLSSDNGVDIIKSTRCVRRVGRPFSQLDDMHLASRPQVKKPLPT